MSLLKSCLKPYRYYHEFEEAKADILEGYILFVKYVVQAKKNNLLLSLDKIYKGFYKANFRVVLTVKHTVNQLVL